MTQNISSTPTPTHELGKNHLLILQSQSSQYSFNDASVANQRNRAIIRSLRQVFGNALTQFALIFENEHDWLMRNGTILAWAMRLNAQAVVQSITRFVEDSTLRPENQINSIRGYIQDIYAYRDFADLIIRRFVRLADDVVHHCMRTQPPSHTHGILEEFSMNTPILTRVWRWALVDMRQIVAFLEMAIDFVVSIDISVREHYD
ncbi:hypothetical protein NHQ30_002141 [Ciborinia camelliae]|nr:hypothetical protein NHQ30_002141 [Ciborinia camelliae]